MSTSIDPLTTLVAQHRFTEAEALCRERLQSNPADAAALGALLPQLIQRREFLQARVYVESAANTDNSQRELLLMLGQVRGLMRDHAAAYAAYAEAVALNSEDWVALLYLADSAESNGNANAALSARVQALNRAERDAALIPDAGVPPHLQTKLQHAIAIVQQARAAHLDAAIEPLLETHGSAALRRATGALDILVGRRPPAVLPPQQHPSLLCIPDLQPQPWFEREQFPFLAQIENETAAIREELLALLDDEAGVVAYIDMPERAPAAPTWRELNRSPRWRSYHFYRHGSPVAAHHDRCSRTSAVLQQQPLAWIPEHAPESMFSMLAPQTRIPAHTGVMNGRLTVHLPLIVPPRCGALKVGGIAREWEEGRCLIFDDSFVHEAWNDSDHLRVVLIFDIWHPDLTPAECSAISTIIAALGEFNRTHDSESALPSAH